MAIVAMHVTIRGRVQGVFYRGWTVKTALSLGLVGWVRNRRNGDVEALVQGEATDVDRFLALARSGPPAARVIDVLPEQADISALQGFQQRETA